MGEGINFHYERKLYKVEDRAEEPTIVDPEEASPAALDLTDPRVTHAMTLAVDEYGNVLRAVAIGYGRRYSFDDPSLDPGVLAEVRARQRKTLLTYSENQYTNAVLEQDAYRTPLPLEARTYEFVERCG